jgi:ABC-2 type transport system permease protein
VIWWQHLQTFLWLNWRIRSNRRKRAAAGNVIIEWILSFLAVFSAAITFLVGLSVGLVVLSRASAPVVMLVWDGVTVAFLLFWLLELLNELQRSEVLTLQKFLHLPVSLSGVFLINYVASLFTLSTTLFPPFMAGLWIGLVFSKGPIMLLLFPVMAGFFLMVTALTYQLRGWLASLMENKRRRRTIITLLTMIVVIIFQIPNLLNFYRFRGTPGTQSARIIQEETNKLDRQLAARQIDKAEYDRKVRLIRTRPAAAGLAAAEQTARTVNTFVPVGWLPYSAVSLLEGRILPSLLATLGLALIGTGSLVRCYGTTLRLYTGQFKGRKPHGTPVVKPKHVTTSTSFLERHLPWVSEHASAIAFAGFRSLTRAPEAKMMLLTPVIFTVVFGSTFLRVHSTPSEFLRPVMSAGVMAMVLLGMIQLAGNQFAFDRSGFRTFVLSGVRRSDILMGKNLALLPFALGLGTIGITALEVAYPMRFDHFIAVAVQMVSMYLVYSLVLNLLSMFAPSAIASGSLKPVRPKGIAVIIHLLFLFFVLPIALATTLVPLGVEFLLRDSAWLSHVPVYLLLTVFELAVILYIYPKALVLQGRILQAREQKILEIVAAKAE